MLPVDAPPRAVLQKASYAFASFARAVRAYRLYNADNSTVVRMVDDLWVALTETLDLTPELTVVVRPEELLAWDSPILEAKDQQEESIAFALYRDGIRRLDFLNGIPRSEVEALVEATSYGLHFAGVGDDIVSLLWRYDLSHVSYVVVDTSIVESDGRPAGDSAAAQPASIDDQINALLSTLYGGAGDGAAHLSLHLDGADLPAKHIADALSDVDNMAAGLRPVRRLGHRPTYFEDIEQEIAEEGEFAITVRGLEGAMHAFGQPLPAGESAALGDALLRMLDTALLEDRFQIATGIVQGVRQSGQTRATIGAFMDEAVSEVRFRHVAATFHQRKATEESRTTALDYFKACGAWAVEPLLALLPQVGDEQLRRALTNLLIEIDIVDLGPVRALLDSEHPDVACEAVYLIAHLSSVDSVTALLRAADHQSPEVRAAVVEHATALPETQGRSLTAQLVQDEDPTVRAAAARVMARFPGQSSLVLLEALVQKDAIDGAPFDLKRAALESYAYLAQARGVQVLHRYIRDGEAFLSGRDAEETAVAAIGALARIRTVAAVEILKRASGSRHKRLKETAKRALLYMKERT